MLGVEFWVGCWSDGWFGGMIAGEKEVAESWVIKGYMYSQQAGMLASGYPHRFLHPCYGGGRAFEKLRSRGFMCAPALVGLGDELESDEKAP